MRKMLFMLPSLALLGGCATSAVHSEVAKGVTAPHGEKPHSVAEFSAAEQNLLDQASQFAVQRCMAAKGFKYHPFGTPAGEQRPASDVGPGEMVDQARKNGYGGDPRAAAPGGDPAGKDLNDEYTHTLSAPEMKRYSAALFGDQQDTVTIRFPDGTSEEYPRSGCITEAQNKAFGSAATYAKYEVALWRLLHGTDEAAEADARVKAAQRKWADCVKKAGHPYRDQMAMRNAALQPYAQAKGDLKKIRQREIEIAVADATCDRKTGVTAVRDRVVQEMIDKNTKAAPAALKEALRLKKAILANARKMIQKGG